MGWCEWNGITETAAGIRYCIKLGDVCIGMNLPPRGNPSVMRASKFVGSALQVLYFGNTWGMGGGDCKACEFGADACILFGGGQPCKIGSSQSCG